MYSTNQIVRGIMTNPNVGFNVISTTSHINGTGEYGIGYCATDEESNIQGKLNITPLFTIKYKSELDNSPEKLNQFQADLLKTELIDFLNWKFPLGIPVADSTESIFNRPPGWLSLLHSSDGHGSAQILQEQLTQEKNTNVLFPKTIPFFIDPVTKTTKSDLNNNQLKVCHIFNRWKQSVIGDHIYCCWCDAIQFILIFDPETTVFSNSDINAQVRLFYLFNDVDFFISLMGGRQSNILHFEDVLQSGHGGDLYQYNSHFEDNLIKILITLAKI